MQYRKLVGPGSKFLPWPWAPVFFGSLTAEADATKIMDLAFEKGMKFI